MLCNSFITAVPECHTFIFCIYFCRDNPKDEIMPRIIGSKNSLCVLLPVPDLIQSLLPSKTMAPFRVTPVFFNMGINEMATLAENLGNTKPQDSSNIDNFDRLNEFCSRYRKLNLANNGNHERQEASISELMNNLKDSLHSNKSKNVDILQIAAKVCRRLKGKILFKYNLTYKIFTELLI